MQIAFLSLFALSACLEGAKAAALHPQTKPAVVMVPGAFHVPQVFEKVIRRLGQDDYKFLDAVALPSVGHLVDRQADTNAVTKALCQFAENRLLRTCANVLATDKHLNAGRDVVLVGNSYGAAVIGEAVKGAPHYSPESDNNAAFQSNRRGRILSLIYLSGYIPYISEVEHPETKQDIHGKSPIFNFHDNNGTVTADADLVHYSPQQAFYNLLPPREADYWTRKLDYSSFEALNATATYIPYTGDFKVVYVIGEQDRAVSLELAQTYIDQPGAKFTVERLDSDHIAMLSRPKEVVELIKKYSVWSSE